MRLRLMKLAFDIVSILAMLWLCAVAWYAIYQVFVRVILPVFAKP